MGKQLSRYVDISTKLLRIVICHKETITFHYETGLSIILSFNTDEKATDIYQKFNWLDSNLTGVSHIYVSDVTFMIGKSYDKYSD